MWSDRWIVAMAAAAVVALGVVRLVVFGFGGVAGDDARYLYVGLSLLDGHGPVTPEGNLFLARAPAYSAIIATAARLVGGDPLVGAHVGASGILLAGLAGAVVLAGRLGGAIAAVATAATLVGTPLVWTLLPTLRVDLVQVAGIVFVLLAFGAGRGSVARAIGAGVLLGLTILVKESVLPLLALPLAAFGRAEVRGWLGRSAAFVAAAGVTISPWWLFVWQEAQILFPLNGIAGIEVRDVERGLALTAHAVVLLFAAAIVWLVILSRAGRDPAVRPLLLTGFLLALPAAYAFSKDLDARNYLGLAVVTAVAAGVAIAGLATAVAGRARPARPSRTPTRLAVVAATALLLATAVAGQAAVRRPNVDALPGIVATWLTEHGRPGDRVLMTFHYRSMIALRMYGEMLVAELSATRPRIADTPGDFVWLGLRDQQVFGYLRDTLATSLAIPETRWFLVIEPHPFTPHALLPALGGTDVTRLTTAARITLGRGTATIYEVDPGRGRQFVDSLPLHLDAASALAWIERRGDDGIDQLVAAAPIVDASAPNPTERLLATLDGVACPEPAGEPYPSGWLRLRAPPASGSCG